MNGWSEYTKRRGIAIYIRKKYNIATGRVQEGGKETPQNIIFRKIRGKVE